MDADPSRSVYRFAAFEFDARTGELRRDGVTVRLQEQPFQVLKLLLARPGELVTRDELREALWPGDTFVDFDTGLNSAVKRLRDALRDSADKPRFVETLPRRGYRFIASLTAEPVAASPHVTPLPVTPPSVTPPSPAGPASAPRRPRWWLVAAALAGVLAAGLLFIRHGAAHPVEIRSLAVLPFQNLTGDPGQEYFVDGVTEALTTDLAQIQALTVISRTSAMRYKNPEKPLPEIAADLGVDGIVEGAVTRSGSQVRITAQLIHAATDQHLWARSYDRDVRDVLALQAEVATAIAEAVRAEIRPDERRRLARATAVETEAYESYLKGRFYWRMRGKENFAAAAGYFQQAIAQDPAFAPAYSGLSDTYRQSDVAGLADPRESMPKAAAAARQALSIDDSLAEAHASLAGVLSRYDWDWAAADREYRRALELDPSYAEGHRAYAVHLLTVRRPEEALAHARRATELSPLSAVMAVEAGFAAAQLDRYREAEDYLARARALEPGFARVDQTRALVFARQGDLARAAGVFDERRASGRTAAGPTWPWAGYFYGRVGRAADARRVLRSFADRAREQYVSPQGAAIVELGLGNRDEALRLLGKACDERAIEVLGFSGPLYDALHDDPGYRALAARMGLAALYWPPIS